MAGTSIKTQRWIVLANTHRARLLRCIQTDLKRCHLEEVDSIESPPSSIQWGRPTQLAGKADHSTAAPHHVVEEEHRRFAKRLADWIDKQIGLHKIERLTVFTAPRALGMIRDQYDSAHRHKQIDLREGNLIDLTDEALQRHPEITALMHPQATD